MTRERTMLTPDKPNPGLTDIFTDELVAVYERMARGLENSEIAQQLCIPHAEVVRQQFRGSLAVAEHVSKRMHQVLDAHGVLLKVGVHHGFISLDRIHRTSFTIGLSIQREVLDLLSQAFNDTYIAEQVGMSKIKLGVVYRELFGEIGALNRNHAMAILYRNPHMLPQESSYTPR